jgi:hypothetical protein
LVTRFKVHHGVLPISSVTSFLMFILVMSLGAQRWHGPGRPWSPEQTTVSHLGYSQLCGMGTGTATAVASGVFRKTQSNGKLRFPGPLVAAQGDAAWLVCTCAVSCSHAVCDTLGLAWYTSVPAAP